MARIRTIKPEFWNSPDTTACTDPWARLLFIAMWNWADDHGRGLATPGELLGFAFPNEEFGPADVRRMLGDVRRTFGVKFYRVRGRAYYCIPSWDTHQKIDKRSGPKHPGPDDGTAYDPDPETPSDLHVSHDSEEPSEGSPKPRRDSGAGTGEQGNRGTGEVGSEPASAGSRVAATATPAAASSELAIVSTPTAQTFVAEWVDHCPERPPGRVIGQVSKELKALLDEGIDPARVRTALIAWNDKGLHPSALASVVHEISNRKPSSRSQQATDDLFTAAMERALAKDSA